MSAKSQPATERTTSLAIASALRTLDAESSGLTALAASLQNGLGEAFQEAVRVLSGAEGRVIVSGIGKSGHIGRKIAATLASTGTPAFFIHPSEAAHGDLGMVTSKDVLLAISWSGETIELKTLVTYSRRFGVPLISITSRATSALGQASDIVIELPRASEACPHGLAPTTSTTMQLVIGDCLAVALLEARGFTATDFKVFHPGGSLGAQLKFVSDLMHKEDRLPLVRVDEPMTSALVTMTQKALGCLGIIDGDGKLVGIITDGDLRRHMGPSLLAVTAGQIMTPNPKTIKPAALASSALDILNKSRITALFVVEGGRPVGLVHVHDLLRASVA
ncbi:MAG TPA: KpsF/GutQ family sugar-phosphate isomerase [Hyphomicrobiaceae bacterium]|nr:KpsF/GutQ family sugar-phosphate isomerase [Hyphomicrobiaceae bacterium]